MSDTEPDPSEQRSDESAEDWARRNRVEADKAVEAGKAEDKEVVLDKGEFVETCTGFSEAKEAHEGN